MKKIITTLMSLIMSTGLLSAHDYYPLVREGVEWECTATYLNYGESKEFDYSIKIIGDSVVDGFSYKKCYYIFANDAFSCNNHAVALLREDVVNQKVYMRLTEKAALCDPFISFSVETEQPEMLLYDFGNINNNEQYWIGWDPEELQAEVIMSNGILLNSYENYIIEGIGCIEEPRDPFTIGGGEISGYPKYHLRVNRYIDENGNVMYDRNYHRLVREGVKWHCLEARITYFPPHGEYVPFYIEIKGDSIVDDVVWKKCYCVFEDSISPAILLREDISTQRVYAHGLRHAMCEGNLLYDFKNITDSYHIWNWSLFSGVEPTLVSESVIDIDGKGHRYYEVTSCNTIIPIIEGIGAIGVHKYSDGYIDYEGNFLYPIPIKIVGGDDVFPIFLHLSDLDGRIIYDGPADIDDFKNTNIEENIENKKNKVNVINRSINISSVEEIKSVRIINMAGMVVDVVSPNENTITIPTDKYPAGHYIIQVATESDITTQKISI